MRKIYLPSINLDSYKSWFAGENSRYATATAVRIIGDKILAAHFLGRMLYLMDFEGNLISQCPTEFETDLMDYHNGFIVCSNLFDRQISIFSIENNQIALVKYVPVPFDRIHGVRFKDDVTVAITSTNNVIFVNIYTHEWRDEMPFFIDQPKDVLFHEDVVFVPTSRSHVKDAPVEVFSDNCTLYACRLPIERAVDDIKMLKLDGQPDAICRRGEDIFISMQDRDSVMRVKYNGELSFVEEIAGLDFPHGIDCNDKCLIVTNYGDNSLTILNV